MDMDYYSKTAIITAIYPGKGEFLGLLYTILQLNGESGEIAEKIGKIIRDKESKISQEDRLAMAYELGDVLWYVNACARELGFDLQTIAALNLEKLASRKERGKLGGSGDER